MGLCVFLHNPSLTMENKEKEKKQESTTSNKKNVNNSSELPIEVIMEIFSLLDIKDILENNIILLNHEIYNSICEKHPQIIKKSEETKKHLEYFCTTFSSLKHQKLYKDMAERIIKILPSENSLYGFTKDELAIAKLNAYYLLWKHDKNDEKLTTSYASDFLKTYEAISNDNLAKKRFKKRYDKLKSSPK